MTAALNGILHGLQVDYKTKKQIISIKIDNDFAEEYDRLADKYLDIKIEPHRKKRSKNANDLCWTLCEKIAQAAGISKEDVYRHAIKYVGVWEPLPVHEDRVQRWQEVWGSRGIGWFAEIIDDSKLPGYKLVHNYYGSSTYNTSEMTRLINFLIDEAKGMGIPTEPPALVSLLLEEWH